MPVLIIEQTLNGKTVSPYYGESAETYYTHLCELKEYVFQPLVGNLLQNLSGEAAHTFVRKITIQQLQSNLEGIHIIIHGQGKI